MALLAIAQVIELVIIIALAYYNLSSYRELRNRIKNYNRRNDRYYDSIQARVKRLENQRRNDNGNE